MIKLKSLTVDGFDAPKSIICANSGAKPHGSRKRDSTKDRDQKAEDRGQKTEIRDQRTENRSQKTEDRGQRPEVRRQIAEVRGKKAGIKIPTLTCYLLFVISDWKTKIEFLLANKKRFIKN